MNLAEDGGQKLENTTPSMEGRSEADEGEISFKDELIENLKNMVACQNIEIENLQNKLVAKK